MISLIIFILWAVSVVSYMVFHAAEDKKLIQIFGAIAFVLTIVMFVLTATKTWGNF